MSRDSRQTLSYVAPRSDGEPPDDFPTRTGADAPPRADHGAVELPPGYIFERELGRGGMGVVYLTHQAGTNRLTAVKMLTAGTHASTTELVRFLTEAEAGAAVAHPNVVSVYQVGETSGRPFMVLEYCAGGSLSDRLRDGPLDAKRAAELLAEVAAGVEAIHARGIIHRDLKPSNILLQTLDGELVPKVADFGLAKRGDGELTVTGAILGSPSYMAPEQADGRGRDASVTSDVYALGAILYECLTARPPFRAATALETIQQVLRDDPVPPRRLQPDVPVDLETIAMKCLQKDPAKRYPTVAEFRADLERFSRGEAILARPQGTIEATWRRIRRRPALSAAVGVSVAALLVLGVGGWISSVRLNEALKVADDRRVEAERHAAEVEKQRRAVADADAVQRTLEEMMLRLDDRLSRAGNMTAVRQEFLEDVRKLNDQLVDKSSDREETLYQSARVYQRLAAAFESRTTPIAALESYEKAGNFYRRLLEREAEPGRYHEGYADVQRRRGALLWKLNRLPETTALYQDVLPVVDRLAALPDSSQKAVSAGKIRLQLAALAERRGDLAEARRWTADAVAVFKDAVTKYASESGVRAGAAEAEFTAALLSDDPNAGMTAVRTVLDFRRFPSPQGERPAVPLDRHLLCFLEDRRDHEAAAAFARGCERPDSRIATHWYNQACWWAIAARIAASAGAKPAVEEYGKQARFALQRAYERGYRNTANVDVDPDLDFLRDRADFRLLMDDLTIVFGPAGGPADIAKAHFAAFTADNQIYGAMTNAPISIPDRRHLARLSPSLKRTWSRIAALYESTPNDPAILAQAVTLRQWAGYGLGAGYGYGKRTDERLKDPMFAESTKVFARFKFHAKANTFVNLLGNDADDASIALLEEIAELHPVPSTRSFALYYLATACGNRMLLASNSDERQRLLDRAEVALNRILRDYGELIWDNRTLQSIAEDKRRELRIPNAGVPAPIIEGFDLNKAPYTSAVPKGHLTLLYFWAEFDFNSWLATDTVHRWMTELEGKPFTVVGINGDTTIETARAGARRANHRFRSFWQDDPKSAQHPGTVWGVNSVPTLILIDADGVVTGRWSGYGEETAVRAEIDRRLAATSR